METVYVVTGFERDRGMGESHSVLRVFRSRTTAEDYLREAEAGRMPTYHGSVQMMDYDWYELEETSLD